MAEAMDVSPRAPPAELMSSTDDEKMDQGVSKQYGRLIPKKVLQKLHPTRRWFDSGEFAMRKQGIVLQDILPGGAPVDVLPAKLQPTSATPRGPSHLHQVTTTTGTKESARIFNPDFAVVDY